MLFLIEIYGNLFSFFFFNQIFFSTSFFSYHHMNRIWSPNTTVILMKIKVFFKIQSWDHYLVLAWLGFSLPPFGRIWFHLIKKRYPPNLNTYRCLAFILIPIFWGKQSYFIGPIFPPHFLLIYWLWKTNNLKEKKN